MERRFELMGKIGCGGPWHYESHSYMSSCPDCRSDNPEKSKWELKPASRAKTDSLKDRSHLKLIK